MDELRCTFVGLEGRGDGFALAISFEESVDVFAGEKVALNKLGTVEALLSGHVRRRQSISAIIRLFRRGIVTSRQHLQELCVYFVADVDQGAVVETPLGDSSLGCKIRMLPTCKLIESVRFSIQMEPVLVCTSY